MLVIQLSGSIEHVFSKGGDGLAPNLLVLFLHGFYELLAYFRLGELVLYDGGVPDQEPHDGAEPAFDSRRLYALEHLRKQIHELGVYQAVAHVRVEDDALEVEERVQLLVDGAVVRGQGLVDVAKVRLYLLGVDLGDDSFVVPRLEREIFGVVGDFLDFFDVFVSNNGLDLVV